ncbi:MAG: PQQ-binding-like beta-propeller repeat protein [Haloarculaceae archaeon]
MDSTAPSRRRFLHQFCGGVGVGALVGAAGCTDASDDVERDRPPGDAATPTPVVTRVPDSPTATDRDPEVPPVDGSWRSFRSDAHNSGATDDPGPTDSGKRVWERTITPGEPVTAPAAADGAVFVVTDSGVVRALSAADSSVRWTGSRHVSPDVPPAVAGDTVVVADGGTLVGLRTDDGRERWTVALEGAVVGVTAGTGWVAAATEGGVAAVRLADGTRAWHHAIDGTPSSAPAVDETTVAVGLATGDAVAVDAESGDRRWREPVAERGAVVPAVSAGRVYAVTTGDSGDSGDGPDVVAFDASSGSEQWSRTMDAPVSGGPVAAADAVFVGTLDTNRQATPPAEGARSGTPTPYPTDTLGYRVRVLSLAPADGSERWRETIEGTYNFTAGPPSMRLTVASGTLLAGIGRAVVAHDPGSGDRRWEAALDGPGFAVTEGVVTTGTGAVSLADGSDLWRYEPGDVVESAPAVVDNRLYVGSDDHHVYAVAANAGTVEWHTRTDGIVRAAPTVDEDTVYVGTLEGTVYAFDRSDGSERWTFDTGDTVQWGAALADGVLYPGLFDSTVLALDADDGAELWRTDPGSPFVTAAPAVGDGAVVAGRNGVLKAFETADGSERWSHTFGGKEGRVQSDAAIAGGRAYVHVGKSLYAFDLASGDEVWSRETGRSNSAPAVRDDVVYASTDGGVYAFDAATGSEVWQAPMPEGREVVVGDGAVYATHYDAPAVALDPADGTELWQASRGTAASTPAVADDYLFFGTADGAVRALGPRS